MLIRLGFGFLFDEHKYAVASKDRSEIIKAEPFYKIYLRTLRFNLQNPRIFDDVKTYCMFIGYPRSGHSLVGFLLNAHPDAVIAHEADILGLVEIGKLRRNQIFSFLLENTRNFAAKGSGWSGYSYQVPSQWQGRFRTLKVIGDKKGGVSTGRIGKNPRLLKQFEGMIRTKIKYIHHLRNPYDIISTVCKRMGLSAVTNETAERYRRMCQTIKEFKAQVNPEDIFEERHEFLIENPKDYLKRLCCFLNLDCPQDYLEDCARVVSVSPHRSRNEIEWSVDMLHSVEEMIGQFDFLKEYSFEGR